jgi:hydroxyethylthiazole kinase
VVICLLVSFPSLNKGAKTPMANSSSHDFGAALRDIRATAPLIHNIANLVVTNVTANALLALGASPAMVENTEEVAEIAAIAGAVVINLGTISPSWAAAMRLAAISAQQAGTPWVLDPVAVGALSYRTRLAAELLEAHPAVIRGNASEIMALAGQAAGGKGVDSLAASDVAIEAAKELAHRYATVVTVSGAIDYVTDGTRLTGIANGHPIMSRVTGMGCTASALTGAYLALLDDPFDAAVQAMAAMGVAGDIALQAGGANIGSGSFQVAFLDALYHLDGAKIAALVRLS